MIRSKLTNKFFKDRTHSNKKAYCKQRNICVNILWYYSNLEVSKVANNKKFWRIVNNFFSDKLNNFKTITLVRNNMVISDDQKIADILIKYFDTIVPKLGLAILKDVIVATNGIEDPVLKALHKYQMHPRMLAIKEKYKDLSFFFFQCKFI